MKSLRPLHSRYIKDCNSKIDRYTAQVGTQTEAVHHLFLLLGGQRINWSSTSITFDGIKKMIDGIALNGNKYYYDNEEIDTIVAATESDIFLIQSYIKSIISYIRKNKVLVNLMNYYKVCSDIPYSLFKETIECFNLDNQKYILQGGIVELGYGAGKLYIREKKKFMDVDNTKYNQKAIDWNESLSTLVNIAKAQEEAGKHNLHHQYTTHYITKAEFIKNMKSYTYNEKSSPELPKWLIYYTNDYNYWVTWERTRPYLVNQQLYSFVPSRVYDESMPKRLDYIATCKSTEDILNARGYGLQDKIGMLLKFDTNYYLNYRR